MLFFRQSLKHYKSYEERVTLNIAPLTILVGTNNSGKSALTQSIHLIASNFAIHGDILRNGLHLNSGGIAHDDSFVDLVTGRSEHGKLLLSAKFSHKGREVCFSTVIQNVAMIPNPSECVIQKWIFENDRQRIELNRNRQSQGTNQFR